MTLLLSNAMAWPLFVRPRPSATSTGSLRRTLRARNLAMATVLKEALQVHSLVSTQASLLRLHVLSIWLVSEFRRRLDTRASRIEARWRADSIDVASSTGTPQCHGTAQCIRPTRSLARLSLTEVKGVPNMSVPDICHGRESKGEDR